MAQRQRAGLITPRSQDRNLLPVYFFPLIQTGFFPLQVCDKEEAEKFKKPVWIPFQILTAEKKTCLDPFSQEEKNLFGSTEKNIPATGFDPVTSEL